MKKIMMLLAFASLTVGVSAQDDYEIPVKKSVITNSFWSNWYVSGGVDFQASYTSEENLGNKNPFSSNRGTFGMDLSIGKWVTPVIGLRTKFQGLWAKQVMTDDLHPAYRYWNLHEDLTVNLSNLFGGYREERVWNLIPYVGWGVARNLSANRYDVSFNAGLLNNFRLNRKLSVFVDLSYQSMDGSFDNAAVDNWTSHSKFALRHCDKMLGLSVGVTYSIGKSRWDKAPDIEALLEMNREQMDALNSSMEDQQMENQRLRQLLGEKKVITTDKAAVHELELVSTSQSVFFNLGSCKVANRKDLIDLKEMVAFARQYGKKVVVTGYADSKTGSAERNFKLSADRAQAVAIELEKMGLSSEAIEIEARGGVDDIAPFSYNRRVIVRFK